MKKSKRPRFNVNLIKPTTPLAVTRLVITPREADGSLVDRDGRLERNLGRHKAIVLALDLLKATDAPKELIQQVEALQGLVELDPEDVELVTADASAEEMKSVERLVGRWSQAVDQALEQKAISSSTASTYRQHPLNFLAWVKGEFQPGGSGRRRRARASTNGAP